MGISDEQLIGFVKNYCKLTPRNWQALAGDASLRRYWRVFLDSGDSVIVMDCRNDRHCAQKFVALNKQLLAVGAAVVKIYHYDEAHALALLQDLGDVCMDEILRRQPQLAMAKILQLLQQWQRQTTTIAKTLPIYGEKLLAEELQLFWQWFLPQLPMIDDKEIAKLPQQAINAQIMANICAQPQMVCVHRDFHCRNLLTNDGGNISIIDYQDAVAGTPCYDLISITRDCYIAYQSAQSCAWEEQFRRENYNNINAKDWEIYCNFTALQRHLKVLGIFVRLAQRDGKYRYLTDIARVFEYAQREAVALAICSAQLAALADFLTHYRVQIIDFLRILPTLKN